MRKAQHATKHTQQMIIRAIQQHITKKKAHNIKQNNAYKKKHHKNIQNNKAQEKQEITNNAKHKDTSKP